MEEGAPPPRRKSVFEEFGEWVSERAKKVLYEHQRNAIEGITTHLRVRPGLKAAAILPTGTGKTPIAIMLPYWLRSKRVLVVTPRTTLRQQYMGSAADSHTEESAFLLKTRIVPSDRKDILGNIKEATDAHALFDGIDVVDGTVANAQIFTDKKGSTRREWREILPPSTYDLVIVDEAHFHPAETWQNICDHFSQGRAQVIFLTATPYRADQSEVCKKEEICYQFLRSEGVKNRIIRDVESIQISFDGKTEKRIDEEQAIEEDEISFSVLLKIKEQLDEHDNLYPLPGGKKHKALLSNHSLM
eukprot:TRINITY_DN17300_c0_g1_i1.p1 TRINITY_DN17300_c0_g1~~TRINITY_DN17300_c0_g1_i1.p1  ORF type:complete len:302 (+),score=53.01 TRINITY_DN17300_c0_g1_i1:1-906(+)